MARATLLEVATKIADCIRAGILHPEQQYTLRALATIVKASPPAVFKVLQMWETLGNTGVTTSIVNLTTSKGNRPAYAIRFNLAPTPGAPHGQGGKA